MKNFKRIIALLLSLVSVLSLCACGGNQAPATEPNETTGTTEPTQDPNTPCMTARP